MSVTRKCEWSATTTDLVVVIRALEPVLALAIHGMDGVARDTGYSIHGEDVVVDDVQNLTESIARMGAEPTLIVVTYHTEIMRLAGPNAVPNFRCSLTVLTVTLGGPVNIIVRIMGPDADSTYGFIDQLRNRINSEVQRQEAASWQAAPLEGPPTPAPEEPSPPDVKWYSAIAKHPLWSALIAGVILLVLTIVAKQYGLG